MQPSEEIRRVINRWLTAVTAGDADPSLERLAEHPGALTIGTDPDEWWHARRHARSGRVSWRNWEECP